MDSSSSKLTPRYMPRKDKTLIWKDTCTPMFIVALITVAKTWKPLNALQWIKLMWYICTVEKYTTIRNNEITPFAATWMDLENILLSKVSSVQSLSHVRLFATPWTAAHQASLSITSSRSLPKLMSIKSVMPSSHLILCCPLPLLPPIPPSIRVFSNEECKS